MSGSRADRPKKSLLVLAKAVRLKRHDEGTVIWSYGGDTFECAMAWRNPSGKAVCKLIAEAVERVLGEEWTG